MVVSCKDIKFPAPESTLEREVATYWQVPQQLAAPAPASLAAASAAS